MAEPGRVLEAVPILKLTAGSRAHRRIYDHRDVLRVHPRGDSTRPQQGVFSTRSPDRPNPIGLHRVEILSIDGARLHVRNLEAVHGTPILDVKPGLGGIDEC